MLWQDSAQSPYRILQAVTFENRGEVDMPVFGVIRADVLEQLFPAVSARIVLTNYSECGFEFHRLFSPVFVRSPTTIRRQLGQL
jgi:hypothetical protein